MNWNEDDVLLGDKIICHRPQSGCQALKHWGAADEKVIEDTADQYFTVLDISGASCFVWSM